MKILIIGNEGFIGGHMSQALICQGHELIGLDIAARDNDAHGYFAHKGDITNPQDVLKAAHGADLVINLAAKHHDFGIRREEFFHINEQGTRICLDCLSQLNIKKFIFYSSVAVYGLRAEASYEEMPVNPMNDYGESKLAGEKVIQEWVNEDPAREALIIRPCVVFGENNWANMYKLIHNIYRRSFVMVGKGEAMKSIAYVGNIVDATLFLMERMHPGIDVFNYSDYEHMTSRQTIDIIKRHLFRANTKFYLPLGPVVAVAGIIDLLAKITRINFHITANRIKKLNTPTLHGSDKVRKLGFKQNVPLDEALGRMVGWYMEEGRFHPERSR